MPLESCSTPVMDSQSEIFSTLDLDFMTRLRQNAFMSSGDRDQLQGLILQATQEADNIRRDISFLQSRLRRMDDQIKWCHSLFSPIRRLPNELLSEIFLHCADESVITDDEDEGSSFPARGLSLVCTHWNAVVSCMPNLWSMLDLWLSWAPGGPTYASNVGLIRLALKKSRDSPLDVSVRIMLPGISDAHNAILGLLFEQSHRLRSFELYSGSKLDIGVFPEVQEEFPLLKHLHISSCFWDTDFNIGRGAFNRAPTLSSLEFDANWLEELVDAPLQQPSHARVWDIFDPFLQHSWANSNSLQHLEISLDRFGKDIPDDLPLYWLSKLQTLSIYLHFDGYHSDSDVYELLVTPKLEKLSVLYRRPEEIDLGVHGYQSFEEFPDVPLLPIQEFEEFLARSICSLTSLTLQDAQFEGDSFTTLLRTLPALEELDYSELGSLSEIRKGPAVTPAFFNAMVSSPVLLPKITHLTLKTRFIEVEDDMIVQMAMVRVGLVSLALHMLDRSSDQGAFQILREVKGRKFHAEVSGPKEEYFFSCSHSWLKESGGH